MFCPSFHIFAPLAHRLITLNPLILLCRTSRPFRGRIRRFPFDLSFIDDATMESVDTCALSSAAPIRPRTPALPAKGKRERWRRALSASRAWRFLWPAQPPRVRRGRKAVSMRRANFAIESTSVECGGVRLCHTRPLHGQLVRRKLASIIIWSLDLNKNATITMQQCSTRFWRQVVFSNATSTRSRE